MFGPKWDSAMYVGWTPPRVYGGSGTTLPLLCERLFPENYRRNDNNNCDTHHLWSTHPGGGNWLFADGSVRFLPYRCNAILPALATRNGGEVMNDVD
jgi:prepilin-type processing-associated H-X9-DG protein